MPSIKPKFVITTVPFVDEDTPLAAPAVLKASLNKHGFDCVGIDLNIEIYNKIKHHPNRQLFLNFFYHQEICQEISEELSKMFDFYAQEILSHKPDIIGLSLFSAECQAFTAWLCAVLKQRSPKTKIIIGGPGLLTLTNTFFKFPDRLKNLNLIDDYITGDGEISLVEYAKGNLSYPGINSTSWTPTENFDKLPTPDFSDYRFFHYKYSSIPIIDSRGCVQDCEFCDVIAFWKKFQYLPAEVIFNQMLEHINKYRIYRFQFGSSICNGNLREFTKLMELISNYNKNIAINVNEEIHWIGSFIIRKAEYHKEELFCQIKESNGFLLCGVESLTESVRIRLGKKFSNQDLEHHLSMCKKYEISLNLLLIAAYPTETEEDYEFTKQWFVDHKIYADIVNHIQLTLPAILPGTALERNVDLELFFNNLEKREKHGNLLMEVIKDCGFNVWPIF